MRTASFAVLHGASTTWFHGSQLPRANKAHYGRALEPVDNLGAHIAEYANFEPDEIRKPESTNRDFYNNQSI